MIDKLNRGDMKTAKECWDKAKMVDLNTTKQVFENKYAHQIAEGYLMIAISELRSFKQLYDNSTIGIDFKVQVELAPNMVIAALENYTAFVPGHTSFDYNFLYATMWLYCRRVVWKREGSQRNFQSYFSKAYELATTIDEYDQLSELKDIIDILRQIRSPYLQSFDMSSVKRNSGLAIISSSHIVKLEVQTPPRLIDLNQCKIFATCKRRGYNDFCRQHRAIGKIISGKIARDKAISEIAARDKSNEVTEVNRTGSGSEDDRVVVKSFWGDFTIFLGIELGFYLLILLFMIPIMILG